MPHDPWLDFRRGIFALDDPDASPFAGLIAFPVNALVAGLRDVFAVHAGG